MISISKQFFTKRFKQFLLIAPAAAVLAACGGGNDSAGYDWGSLPPASSVTNPETAPSVATSSVSGQVANSVDNTPVANAKVSVGNLSTTTDAEGRFTLESVPQAERAMVQAAAPGFSEGFRIAGLRVDAVVVNIRLQPVDVTQTVSAGSDSIVTIPDSPGRLALSGGSLVKPDGTPATGDVQVSLTAIQPGLDVNAMPGDYRVLTADGTGIMESFGAMAIDLRDSEGSKLNLAPGRTATLRIPLSTRHPSPAPTIPLFFFDEATGYWRQEGSATLAGTAPAQYYEGAVAHFSYWNADQLMNTIQVNGCVVDEAGARVANARLFSDGVDYSGSSWALSDTDGNFSLPVKRDSQAIVNAQSGLLFSNSVKTQSSSSDFSFPSCLTLSATPHALSIKLTWGAKPSDVDSHLYAPDGTHVYYSNKGSLIAPPYANLDVDDTSSHGPEVVTLRQLMVGTYTYALRNFSGTHAPGMTDSPVRVELNQSGAFSTYTPGPGETDRTEWWTAFTLTVAENCLVTVTPIDTWSERAPVATPVAARYCAAS